MRAIPIKRNKNMRYSEILAAPALRRMAAPARGAAPARRENFEFLRPRERKFAYHLKAHMLTLVTFKIT